MSTTTTEPHDDQQPGWAAMVQKHIKRAMIVLQEHGAEAPAVLLFERDGALGQITINCGSRVGRAIITAAADDIISEQDQDD